MPGLVHRFAASGWLLLLPLPLLILLLAPSPAEAGNRIGACGGVGQRGCCVHEIIPSCDGALVERVGEGPGAGASCGSVLGIPIFAAGTCYNQNFPPQCGGLNERPCNFTEHNDDCMSGLTAIGLFCRDTGDDFPLTCGRQDQRACTLFEHFPSCMPGLEELFNTNGGGFCRAIDADGFPTHCGGRGEPACQILENLPSCKSNAYEVATPKLPALANGWCVDDEDFSSAPFRLDRPTAQAPPGPRSVFLIHGLGGDRSDYDFDPLHEPARGFYRYWVDANWSGEDGSDDDPVAVRIFDKPGGSFRALCGKGTRIDGYTFSVPLTARLLKDALLDEADCRAPENPPPDGVENVTLVAHSMGGVVVRDLVYRHYDELLAAGVRIAEVVTLGSPHRGGGAEIPELFNVQRLACVVGAFNLAAHQSCLLGNWHAALRDERERRDQDGAPYVDNLDFPGIRWVTIAASDSQQPLSSIFGDDLVAQDNLVAHVSAFGIAADHCFPSVDDEAPPAEVTGRQVANIDESQAWIEHFWPPQVVSRGQDPTSPYGYNPFHDLDLSPAALLTSVPANDAGALTAQCHDPGPSSQTPGARYLAGVTAPDFANSAQQGERFFMLGEGNPHGDIVAGSRYANASVHYLKTILSDGLRGADVNGDGAIDGSDRARLISEFPGNIPAPAGSAFEGGFDVWSDLDGDGFVTLVDLVKWQQLEASASAQAAASAPAPAAGQDPPAPSCGLLGIEPLLALGALRLVRRRRGGGALAAALLCAGVLVQPERAGADVIVRLVPTVSSVGLDETFTIELRASLSNPVSAFGLDVHWQDSAFDYASPAVFAAGWVRLSDLEGPPADPFPSLDLLNLAAVAIPGPAVGSDLLLATLSFQAKQAGLHAFEISITPTDLTEGFALTTPGSFDAVTTLGATLTVVPEPTTAALLSGGLLALALGARRRRPASPR